MTEYLRFLRSHVGHAPLLQCGAGVILLDGEGRILLQLRADNRCWGYAGGAVEPGETVEQAAARELREETGLTAGSLELFGVFSGPELHYVYPNGDEVHNIDIVFLCRDWSGTLRPQPGEVLELAFFSPQRLPSPLSPPCIPPLRRCLQHLGHPGGI